MKTIEIKSLPKINFAHEFSRADYRNIFKVQRGKIEISYLLDGQLQFTDGDRKYTAREGEISCMLYESERSVFSRGMHTHRTVCAEVEWCESAQGICIPKLIRADGAEKARRIIDRAVFEKNWYLGSPTREAELFLNLLCEIDRLSFKSEPHGDSVYARRAKKYVAEHLREPVTQRDIAGALGITPGYLCAVFKKTQGQTLMQYINRAKLSAVRGIMEKENLHLYEASALYGYSDPNYVSRLYKKIFSKNITDK